jgi:hypothetical protein
MSKPDPIEVTLESLPLGRVLSLARVGLAATEVGSELLEAVGPKLKVGDHLYRDGVRVLIEENRWLRGVVNDRR